MAATHGSKEEGDLLAQTLAAEKEADKMLSDIAENDMNDEAKEEKII